MSVLFSKGDTGRDLANNRGAPAWLSKTVFYQIYPQSYFDTNGDGIGDLEGIIRKLDYIQALGVNALWLNPVFVSPFRDAGYDVADYYRIAPRYGQNRDIDRLCCEAHRRGIKVCLDLVAGHTSLEHPWFKKSCQVRRNQYSDRYIWTNAVWDRGDGSVPFIQGYCDRNGNYAINFFYCQPALNYGFARPAPGQTWQQPVDAPGPQATRRELLKIMLYWLKRGIDGFRVDMAASLVKNDPDHIETIKLWQEISRQVKSAYPEMALISEWGNPRESAAAGFDVDFMFHIGVQGYKELMLEPDCFFRRRGGRGITPFLNSYLEQISGISGLTRISIPSSNHDFKRPCSDGRTAADLKVIFTFLLTWPGVPFIYYGDEIGLRYLPGLPSREGGFERCGTRTPMQWNSQPNAGFSSSNYSRLYLPIDPRRHRPDVEAQAKDPQSLLNHVRKLTALRQSSAALQADGRLIPLFAEDSQPQFVYIRECQNEKFLIALNPSGRAAEVRIPEVALRSFVLKAGNGVRIIDADSGFRMKMEAVCGAVFTVEVS